MLTTKEKRKINKELRIKDDSHLFPIYGKFNATERAIRRLRKFARCNGEMESGYEYLLAVEHEIKKIVNNE